MIDLRISEIPWSFAFSIARTIYLTPLAHRLPISGLVSVIEHETLHIVLATKISPRASDQLDDFLIFCYLLNTLDEMKR